MAGRGRGVGAGLVPARFVEFEESGQPQGLAPTIEFMNWSNFFSMGGYAVYVWGSYGVTFVLLGAEVLMLLKRKRDLASRESPQQFADRNSQLESSFQENQ